MEFEVRCAFREGRIVPRWAWYALPTYRGHLIVEEQRDDQITRSLKVARLIATNQREQPTIALHDPQLVYASIDSLVLLGVEQVETSAGLRSFAQRWVCSVVERNRAGAQ